MWSFWVEKNLCSFSPATFLCLSQAMTRISNVICLGLFVLSEKMRGDCSFCCYWLNCWPSLFEHSFHNFSYIVLLLSLTVNQLILQRMGFRLSVFYNKHNFKTYSNMTKFYSPNKSIYYFFKVNTKISTSFRQSMLISFWIDMISICALSMS